MRKKLFITMALVAVTTLTIPAYTLADTASNNTPASAVTTNVTNTAADSKDAEAPASVSLSLDEALNLVEKGNSNIILMDRQIEIYDKQYQQASAQVKAQQDQGISDADDMKIVRYNAPAALADLNNAKHQRDDELKSVKVEITDEYESVLAAEMNVDNINDQIKNLQTTIDQVNLKIKLGLAKAADIEQYKAKMATLQASLSSAQRSIDTAMLTLKQDLGMNLNTKLTLTSKPFEYVKFDDTNIDGRIQKAIESSYDITSQKQDIENEKIEYDIYLHYQDAQMDSLEIDIADKQATLDNLPATLEVQYRTAYNNLKSAENTVEAQKLSIESAQINVNVAQANYDTGNTSYLDLLNAKLALSTEKNTLQQNINSYMKLVKDFQNTLNEQ